MKLSHLVAAGALAGAAQMACAPDVQDADSLSSSKEKQMVEYKQNPNPTQAYLITMRIEGAPGPFASIKGFAQYDIVGEECLPVRDRFSGAQTTSSTAVRPVEFARLSEGTYTATIYADGMQDADYFGRGICRWKFTLVRAELKATGAKEETAFLPGMWADAVLAQKAETRYFWNGRYPRSNIEDFPEFGQSSQDRFKPELRDDLFAVTLSAKEVTP